MKIERSTRVLVLSHNAFSQSQNNGKTLESFFGGWVRDNIAQIFLQPEEPDWKFCSNYFQITDYDVLNHRITLAHPGRVMTPATQKGLNSNEQHYLVRKLYASRRGGKQRTGVGAFLHRQFVNRVPVFVAAREVLWSGHPWASRHLVEWIKSFSPDVLFFQGSSCVFGYRLAHWVRELTGVPLILQLTDDYTYRSCPLSVAERLTNWRYLRVFQRAVDSASCIIAISEGMVEEYGRRFGGRYEVLMNSAPRPAGTSTPTDVASNEFRLIYAGNVGLNRWKSLVQVGMALAEVNSRTGAMARLDVFAPDSTPEEVIRALRDVPTIRYGGFLTSDRLDEQIRSSDAVVHVESFDRRMREVTRLSISTKIPEYLASGRAIYAFGPPDVESIRYLQRNAVAVVTSEPTVSQAVSDLTELIENTDERRQMSARAMQLYEACHTREAAERAIARMIGDALNADV